MAGIRRTLVGRGRITPFTASCFLGSALGVVFSASTAQAQICPDGQTRYVYQVGQGGDDVALPDMLIRGDGFEDWRGPSGQYRIARLSGFPKQVTGGTMFERFQGRKSTDGEAVPTIVLGNFSDIWPRPADGAAMEKIADARPVQTTERGHKSDLSISSYDRAGETGDLVSGLNAPDFSGEIVYYIAANAQIEFIELSLCSTQAPPKIEAAPPVEKALRATPAQTPVATQFVTDSDTASFSGPSDEGREAQKVQIFEDGFGDINKLTLDDIMTETRPRPDRTLDVSSPLYATALIPALRTQSRLDGIAAGGMALMALIDALLRVLNAGASALSPSRGQRQNKTDSFGSRADRGMAFPGSTMRVRPMGQRHPARKAYDAVGRVGYAQVGKPTGDDAIFGTAVLISSTHVMTNRHVWDFNQDGILNGGGVEFMGIKHKAGSDFYRFTGPPQILPDVDAVVFTLERPVQGRDPLGMTARDPQNFEGRDIIVIGYPARPRYIRRNVARIVERFNPVFAVKRWSKGRIFRHSVDDDAVFGVEAPVNEHIDSDGSIRAVCHNASTLGGSSGSAVVDAVTGEWLALHFSAGGWYQKAEDTNFAMPICDILDAMDRAKNPAEKAGLTKSDAE